MKDFREVMAEVTKAAVDCRQDMKGALGIDPPKLPAVGELVMAASVVYLATTLAEVCRQAREDSQREAAGR